MTMLATLSTEAVVPADHPLRQIRTIVAWTKSQPLLDLALSRQIAADRPRMRCPPPGRILPSFMTATWVSSPGASRS